MMFDYLVDKNKIAIKPNDRVFIKQLIHRDPEKKVDTGRSKEKDFLYEVISNEESGIDVDKWDYFARDCYHLGFKNNFDHNRLIRFSRVIKAEGGWHICYRDKQVEDIYHMFLSRVILHRRACQHKTVQILERMYMEALEKANEHYRINTSDGKEWKISECIKVPEAFSQLTDHVFRDIRNSTKKDLKEAKEILERIDKRKHYRLVSEAIPTRDEETGLKLSYDCVRCDEERILSEIVECSKKKLKPEEKRIMKKVTETSKSILSEEEQQILEEIVKCSNGELKQEDLLVDITIFNYGKKDKNLVDEVYFYNKPRQGEKYKAFHMKREDISRLLPDVYSEHHIRLYIKKNDDALLLEKARTSFRTWCEKRNMGGKWKFQDLSKDE